MTRMADLAHGSRLATGGLLVVAGEGIALPAAFLLFAFLARRLGPSGYGLFALATAIVAWIEWTVTSMLSRAIIREASAASADPALGSAALQINLLIGGAAAAALWALAPAIGWLVHDAGIVPPLRLLSLDVPIFAATMAHRGLLVAAGSYRARAALPAVRWIARLVAVIVLVQLGWSLSGAVAGCLIASVIELGAARIAVRPSLLRRPSALWRRLLGDALPFLALGLTLRLFDRVDLLMFKVLGGSTADAGIYGAAQNAAMALSVVSIAFPPLLLATLARLNETGDRRRAATIASQSLRVVCWLLPLVGIAYGAGTQTAGWLFGRSFESGGPLLAPLVLTAIAQVVVAVVVMTLSAAGSPNLFLWPGLVMLAAAVAGGAVAIPRYGAMGAAAATSVAGVVGAAWALRLAYLKANVTPPVTALARGIAAAIAAGAACQIAASTLPLGVTLSLGGLAALVTLQVTGELRPSELRAMISAATASAPSPVFTEARG